MLMVEKEQLESLKLGDFGLSVRLLQNNLFSLRQKCGTLSYMAPELVKSKLPM
jgi:serine/threonine protein kinase